jgi:hypothetical protein
MKLRDDKKNNVIISGLRPDENRSDRDLVIDLFKDLSFYGSPMHVKRIGKSLRGKPPLVLVCLSTIDDRRIILRNAKHLRQLTCEYTRANVYINPDRTPMEREEYKQYRASRSNNHVASSLLNVHQTAVSEQTLVKFVASSPDQAIVTHIATSLSNN